MLTTGIKSFGFEIINRTSVNILNKTDNICFAVNNILVQMSLSYSTNFILKYGLFWKKWLFTTSNYYL